MLIELTDEAIEQGFVLDEAAEWFWRGLGTLAHAHRDGRHQLAAGFRLEDLVRRHPTRFDPFAAAALRSVRATDRHATVDAVRVRVRVVPGQAIGPLWTAPNTPFTASMDWFREESATRPTLLIVEGNDDGDVLQGVAAAWASQHRLPPPALERSIGAGGNYLHTLALVQERRTPWIGVLDSDRDAPGAPLGTTATSARRTWEKRGVGELRILDVHELENLMPATLAHQVAERVPEWRAAIDARFLDPARFADRHADLKDLIGDSFLTRCADVLRTMSPHAAWRLLALLPGDALEDLARTLADFGRAQPRTRT